MKKWVVLSCTPNSVYDFFLPISVRLWRKLIGYEPVIVLVGEKNDWSSSHAGVVYNEICGQERIEYFPRITDLPDSTVSMGLRQHVSALDFAPDDVLLVGDVDLFPVDRAFYHRYDPMKNPIGVYYADMYNDRYWPAYGISMPVRNWREVMGVKVGDIVGSVEKAFTDGNIRDLIAENKTDPMGANWWTFDEVYATIRVRSSRFINDIAKFPSSVDGKRPHRVDLPRNPEASNYIDFHCSRPGWNGANWPGIRSMLSQMIPGDLDWIDRYVKTYRASL